jgi:hypothetical protein
LTSPCFVTKWPLTLDFVLGSLQASVNARADHRPLELGEGPRDLEHELARRRRRVQVLLIEVQIDAAGLEVLSRVRLRLALEMMQLSRQFSLFRYFLK